MLYLVDGYNVTRSDVATRRLPLASQRDALVRRLRVRGRDLLGAGRIVVVFDGEGGAGPSAEDGVPVEVRFSRGERADDVLARLAERAAEKVVLVSSDRELRDRVRTHARHGSEVRGASSLWEGAGSGADGQRRGPGKMRRGPRVPADAGLPKGANRITEEMKKLWLDPDGPGADGTREE